VENGGTDVVPRRLSPGMTSLGAVAALLSVPPVQHQDEGQDHHGNDQQQYAAGAGDKQLGQAYRTQTRHNVLLQSITAINDIMAQLRAQNKDTGGTVYAANRVRVLVGSWLLPALANGPWGMYN